MSKRLRDSLFFVFIALFIVLTISISFYAAGYRFVWHWPLNFSQVLQRTGMLIVESTPSNALVEISNFKTEKILTTPAKISNLLPGEYIVKLEKDGYWPIEKKLRIFPNQTSHLTNIFLFKKSLPINIHPGQFQNLMISPDFTFLLFPDKQIAFNLKNESSVELPKDLDLSSINWSLDNKKIVVENKIIDLSSGQIVLDLNEISRKQTNNITWDEINNRFFYQENNNIYAFSLTNNLPELILSDKEIIDYLIKGSDLQVIEKENNSIYLNTYSLNSQLKTASVKLPYGDYQLYFPLHSFLNIYDKKHKRLILINNNLFLNQQKIIENVVSWYWPKANHLLWHNDQEIHSWNTSQGDKLILRLSQPITGFAWHSQRNYLIYSTKDAIFLSFTENNRSRNLEILRASNISSLFLDQKNKLIYFQADIGKQSGLFKMFLE